MFVLLFKLHLKFIGKYAQLWFKFNLILSYSLASSHSIHMMKFHYFTWLNIPYITLRVHSLKFIHILTLLLSHSFLFCHSYFSMLIWNVIKKHSSNQTDEGFFSFFCSFHKFMSHVEYELKCCFTFCFALPSGNEFLSKNSPCRLLLFFSHLQKVLTCVSCSIMNSFILKEILAIQSQIY